MERLRIITAHLASNPAEEVCIVAMGRSPVHPSGGALKNLSMPELAASTIKPILQKYQINPSVIEELYVGCVSTTNAGQSPSKQAAVLAGLPDSVSCFTINKLCASGMKAVTLGCLSIKCGLATCVLAGGAEAMSSYPYTVQARNGIGNKVRDSLGSDVLPDAVTKELPIKISDYVSSKLRITKEQLDDYAALSCRRAAEATKTGKFSREIVEIQHPKLVQPVNQDSLRLAVNVKKSEIFKGGSTSVGNACGINDGASFVLLTNRKTANDNQWKVLATVKDFADAEQESNLFPLSPALAVQKMMARNQFSLEQVQVFEFNEPFASVVLGNSLMLRIPVERINVNGGALALGHPVGSSGCRVIVSLVSELIEQKKNLGIAAICNGAGGATAVLIQAEF